MMSSTVLAVPPSSPLLLYQVRERIRVKHLRLRATPTYVLWIKDHAFINDNLKFRNMGEVEVEVEAFLSALVLLCH